MASASCEKEFEITVQEAFPDSVWLDQATFDVWAALPGGPPPEAREFTRLDAPPDLHYISGPLGFYGQILDNIGMPGRNLLTLETGGGTINFVRMGGTGPLGSWEYESDTMPGDSFPPGYIATISATP